MRQLACLLMIVSMPGCGAEDEPDSRYVRPLPPQLTDADLERLEAVMTGEVRITVSGRVADEAGEAVAGATIWLAPVWNDREPQPSDAVATVAGEDGRYQITATGPRDVLLWQVLAHAPGSAPAGKWLQRTNEKGSVDLTLPAGETMRVRLVDGQNQPVKNAQLTVMASRVGLGGDSLKRTVSRLLSQSARTSDDGFLTIRNIPRDGSVTLRGQAEPWGEFTRTIRSQPEVTIQLRPMGRIAGQVRINGRPAPAGVRLRVGSSGSRARQFSMPPSGHVEIVTDDTGGFEAEVLSGPLFVHLARGSTQRFQLAHRTDSKQLKCAAGQRTVFTIDLLAAVLVVGVVRDKLTGEPVAGVPVSVSSRLARTHNVVAFTNRDGKYAAWVVPGEVHVGVPERWAVSALPLPAPYLPPAKAMTHQLANDQSVVTLPPIELSRGPVVGGTVVNADGQPLDGATVYAIVDHSGERAYWMVHRVQTGADGRFLHDQLGGAVGVSLLATSGRLGVPAPVRVDIGSTDVKLSLSDDAVQVTRGRVLDDAGTPLADVEIRCTAYLATASGRKPLSLGMWSRRGGIVSDAAGQFVLPALPITTTVEYSANYGGWERSVVQVSISELADGELPPLTFPSLLTAAGQVVDSAAQPLAGVEVFSFERPPGRQSAWDQAIGTPRRTRSTTTADGQFHVDDIPSIGPMLFASKDGYRFFGARVHDGQPLRIEMRRLDEPALESAEVHSARHTDAELRQRLHLLLDPLSNREFDRVMRRLAPYDSEWVLGRYDQRHIPADVFALCGRHEEALEQLSRQQQAVQRCSMALRLMNVMPEEYRSRCLTTAREAFDAIENPSQRGSSMKLALRLAESGDVEAARTLLGPVPQRTTRRGRNFDGFMLPISRGVVEALCDPQAVEATLDRLSLRGKANRLPSICYRLAPLHLEQAQSLADSIRREHHELEAVLWRSALCCGAMALALRDTDPAEARDLIREALRRLSHEPISTMFPPIQWDRRRYQTEIALVGMAEQVDPELTAECFWKAVSTFPMRTGWRGKVISSPSININRYAQLALLFGLCGRERDLCRQWLEPVIEASRAWDRNSLAWYRESVAVLALVDIQAAAGWLAEARAHVPPGEQHVLHEIAFLMADIACTEPTAAWNKAMKRMLKIQPVDDDRGDDRW